MDDYKSLLLPREPFLFEFERNNYPNIPIHYEVDEFISNQDFYWYKPLRGENVPELKKKIMGDAKEILMENIYEVFKEKAPKLYSPEKLTNHVSEALDPSKKLYTINGIFNINCDSCTRVETQTKYLPFDYDSFINKIGEENVALLNDLLKKYTNPKTSEIKLVRTHNFFVSEFDHLVHIEWAIAVNNTILKHLYENK